MPKLNQIVAVERGLKSSMEKEVTTLYHAFQSAAAFGGVSKTYEPLNVADEVLPGEYQKVVHKAGTLLDNLNDHLARLFDVAATKVWANTKAKADVVVDGDVLLHDVPVEYLMFLAQWLVNIKTILGKVPTLDPAYTWAPDEARECYVTEPVTSHRTKKMPKDMVVVPATDKHPAQTRQWDEDVWVGTWTRVQMSGALPAERITELKARVTELQKAVLFAREEANSMEVEDQKPSRPLLEFLFH